MVRAALALSRRPTSRGRDWCRSEIFQGLFSGIDRDWCHFRPNLDIVCGANPLPFRSGSLGGVVMLDVLHHLPEPLEFLNEASRVLRPGGRLVMIEPCITCPSYLLYRYFHDEDC
jgi:SAM-dependent methyltransferase